MNNASQTGADVRRLARAGELSSPTAGLAMGFVQANLVVVPGVLADDFRVFCENNPKPCPLLDVTAPGDPEPRKVAPGADLRTDLPRYCVYRDGVLIDEPVDLRTWWKDDLVAFLLGCSFTFENALLEAGVPVRHLEEKRNVPMYRTNIACRPSGIFQGPMVVSMRPMLPALVETARQVCARFPRAHGEPVHAGDPSALGIADIHRPDFGDGVTIQPGEVLGGDNVNTPAVAVKRDGPLAHREQGVVSTAADIQAGMILRAALADDDAARLDVLAAVSLDAKALRV